MQLEYLSLQSLLTLKRSGRMNSHWLKKALFLKDKAFIMSKYGRLGARGEVADYEVKLLNTAAFQLKGNKTTWNQLRPTHMAHNTLGLQYS